LIPQAQSLKTHHSSQGVKTMNMNEQAVFSGTRTDAA